MTQSEHRVNCASHYRVIGALLMRIDWNRTITLGLMGGTGITL
jgi:hypothetical protein